MAVEAFDDDVVDLTERLTATTSSEDLAAALLLQAELLSETADELHGRAVKLVAQSNRLRQIAERVQSKGIAAIGRVSVNPELDLTKAVRDFLRDDIASEQAIAEHLGLSVRQVRAALAPMVQARDVVAVGRGANRMYGWVKPDVADGNPRKTPRSEPQVQAAVRRDAQMIDVDRGKPVRLVTSNRDRRARSTPGQRHRMKMQDKRYEAMEEAKAARAEAQRAKAKAEPAPKKGKRK